MRCVHVGCVSMWALVSAIAAAPASAQATTEAVVMLSADTIGQGDVFELSVDLGVPPGSAVYFPDTLPVVFGMESFRPVSWSAEPVADGAALTLTYPLIAFEVGLAPVPGLDVFIGPGAGVSGASLPGGSVVGSWSDVETGTVARTSLTRAAVPRQIAWVASVLLLEDIDGELEPRPPADVVGADWDRSSVVAILALSALLLAVVGSVAMRLLAAGRAEEEPLETAPRVDPARVRWQQALDELDRILALGLHTDGRTADFYAQSSGVLRSYVEGFDTEWGPSLTSSELMARLEATTNGSAPELYVSMGTAEVVKFGLLRPDAVTAESHWQALRSWVHTSRSVAG